MQDSRVVAECLMAFGEGPGGQRTLNAWGLPAFYWQAPQLAPLVKGALERMLKRELELRCSEYPSTELTFLDVLCGGEVSLLGKILLSRGALCEHLHMQHIDLRLPEPEIRAGLRKSYKSLINSGLRDFSIRQYGAEFITPEIVKEFRQLHMAVAGRQTRCRESWLAQLEAIQNRGAFIVMVRRGDELIGASYFICSPETCYYGVGAYRRDLFPLPISHASVWTGILHAKKIGCLRFEMGQLFFTGDRGKASDKELSIAEFKRGFGGHVQVQLRLTLPFLAGE